MIQTLEFIGFLDGRNIVGFLHYTNEIPVSLRIDADCTGVALCNVRADSTVLHVPFSLDEGVCE